MPRDWSANRSRQGGRRQRRSVLDEEAIMHKVDPAGIGRVVEMAWEDRTPFEAIETTYGLNETEVIRLMRRELSEKAFKRWRARVNGRATKHRQKRPAGVGRHQASTHNKVNR
jgi:uncharacterized protein (TIGR03643 family)